MVVYNVTINITLVVFYTCLIMNKSLLFMAHKYTLLQHSYKDSATTGWKDCVTTNCIIKLYTYHRSSVVPPTLAKLAG